MESMPKFNRKHVVMYTQNNLSYLSESTFSVFNIVSKYYQNPPRIVGAIVFTIGDDDEGIHIILTYTNRTSFFHFAFSILNANLRFRNCAEK